MELIKYSDTYGNGGNYLGRQIYAKKPVPNGIECPNCGNELIDDDPGMTFESYPAQTSIACTYQPCSFHGLRYLSDDPAINLDEEVEETVKVTRVEIIEPCGRVYTKMNAASVELSYQDDGKTLKIFIK